MKIIGIIEEDFINYKKPCMTINFPYCTFKCDKECGMPVCQNSELATAPHIEVNIDSLIIRYINNPITHAICMQGLEPLDSFDDVIEFIHKLRMICDDDIVIYTGYTKEEIVNKKYYQQLQQYKNIIIKFGRFIPNKESHKDEVLGVTLASDNQYAELITK